MKLHPRHAKGFKPTYDFEQGLLILANFERTLELRVTLVVFKPVQTNLTYKYKYVYVKYAYILLFFFLMRTMELYSKMNSYCRK